MPHGVFYWLGAAAILAALLFFLFRGRRPAPNFDGALENWIIPDEWSLSAGTHDGKPIITRVNTGLKPLFGHQLFPKQLGIAVPFRQPREDGFPGSDESPQLDEIEAKIYERFRRGNQSLFAAVITTGGMREFVLYTSNAEAATRLAGELAAETNHHEVQFVVNEDPHWNVLRAFAGVPPVID